VTTPEVIHDGCKCEELSTTPFADSIESLRLAGTHFSDPVSQDFETSEIACKSRWADDNLALCSGVLSTSWSPGIRSSHQCVRQRLNRGAL